MNLRCKAARILENAIVKSTMSGRVSYSPEEICSFFSPTLVSDFESDAGVCYVSEAQPPLDNSEMPKFKAKWKTKMSKTSLNAKSEKKKNDPGHALSLGHALSAADTAMTQSVGVDSGPFPSKPKTEHHEMKVVKTNKKTKDKQKEPDTTSRPKQILFREPEVYAEVDVGGWTKKAKTKAAAFDDLMKEEHSHPIQFSQKSKPESTKEMTREALPRQKTQHPEAIDVSKIFVQRREIPEATSNPPVPPQAFHIPQRPVINYAQVTPQPPPEPRKRMFTIVME